MKKIGVSFKDSELYMVEHLRKQLSVSIYIKELIKKDIEATGSLSTTSNKSINNKQSEKRAVSFDW